MLTRRDFEGLLVATAAVSLIDPASVLAQKVGFICGTVDLEPRSAIRDMAGGPMTGTIVEYAGRNFSITDYGTSYFPERWDRGHGLTPNTGVITLGIHFLDGRPS